ncbi:MAG: hypothetical protein WD648_03465 [Planctomycetaceae bacterium]
MAVFTFGIAFLVELATEAAYHDDNFYQREAWPMALALLIAGLLSYVVGLLLSHTNERRLIDPDTQEEVIIGGGNHTLFFIKMHWWGVILIAVAAFLLLRGSF